MASAAAEQHVELFLRDGESEHPLAASGSMGAPRARETELVVVHKNLFFMKNLPRSERALRVALGGAAATFGFAYGGVVGIVGVASGIVFALSGAFGFCPMCAMVGRRLSGKS